MNRYGDFLVGQGIIPPGPARPPGPGLDTVLNSIFGANRPQATPSYTSLSLDDFIAAFRSQGPVNLGNYGGNGATVMDGTNATGGMLQTYAGHPLKKKMRF